MGNAPFTSSSLAHTYYAFFNMLAIVFAPFLELLDCKCFHEDLPNNSPSVFIPVRLESRPSMSCFAACLPYSLTDIVKYGSAISRAHTHLLSSATASSHVQSRVTLNHNHLKRIKEDTNEGTCP